MDNATNKIKNTLEATNSRIMEAENKFEMISIFLNLPRLDLWPRM